MNMANKIKVLFGGLTLVAASGLTYAQPVSTLAVENASDYYYLLQGVTQEDASCQESCWPTLSPGNGQQWVEIESDTGWIDLQYEVCENINYSDTGTPICDNWLGHFGISFSKTQTNISSTESGEVDLSYNNNIFKAIFIPDNPPASEMPPAPQSYSTIPLRGANIAAAEFATQDGSIEWILQGGFPSKSDLIYFANKGMNTYRFPIRWSYIQPELGGPLEERYLSQLINSTKLYLDAGYNVIIDLHNYMHFQPDSSLEPANSGELVSQQDMVDIWDKLSEALAPLAKEYPNSEHSNQLIFDLMNEPTEDIPSSKIVEYYNAVLANLRDKGIDNLVLLEGAHYSGMHSWLSATDSLGETNANAFLPTNIFDPRSNYAINVHQYFDSNYSGTQTTCTGFPKEKIEAFLNWSTKNNVPYMVTEFGGPDAGGCQPIINDFLTTLQDENKDDLYLGWTVWAGGSHWGNYLLSVSQGGQAEGLPNYLIENDFLEADNDEVQ